MNARLVCLALRSRQRRLVHPAGTQSQHARPRPPPRRDRSLRKHGPFDPSSPQLERIRVVPVMTATLAVEEFDVPGKVEAVPTRLAKVALPVSGRVRQVMVTLGDHVRSGQSC